MIYNLVSSDAVIAKVMSDLNIQQESIRIADMISWIGEAVEKIGAVTQMQYHMSGSEGVPSFKIENYQVALPDNLHSLGNVAYGVAENGPWGPMRMTTGSFKMKPDVYDKATPPDGGNDSDYPILAKNEFDPNATNYTNDNQYFIKPGYIVTNRKEGWLKLSWTSQPVDSCGYPMIPDLASYFEAIYWYIVMKLKYPEYLSGRLAQHIYYDARRSWNFYRQQAYAEALMPNEDQLISIKNNWLKLVPEINEENTFYSTIGKQQQIYNSYYGRLV